MTKTQRAKLSGCSGFFVLWILVATIDFMEGTPFGRAMANATVFIIVLLSVMLGIYLVAEWIMKGSDDT